MSRWDRSSRAREECWDDLRRVHAETGVTMLVFTDNPVEALALADQLAVMDLGKIVQCGTPQELYSRPLDVFVARLLGPTNLLARPGREPDDRSQGRSRGAHASGTFDRAHDPGARGPGAPVTISVRPETVSLGPSTPAGWNRFPATIERIIFRGELRQIHLRGPGDWPVVVSALQSQSTSLREGQSLTLSVAPEHVVVLSGKFAVGRGA